MADGFAPENKNAAREPASFDGSPIPRMRKFVAKTIDALKISSSLNKADQRRLVCSNDFEDMSRGMPRGYAPAIPA